MSAAYDEMQSKVDAANKVRLEISLAKISEANGRLFARECAAAGIDPSSGVSPSLLKLLREKPAPTEDES